MNIYEFSDYKKYVLKKIALMPGKGRGELSRIAEHLAISTTMVTHVLKGYTNFSLEQTLKLAKYLALNELEREYLVQMVQFQRAGDQQTKEYFSAKLNELRNKALNLKSRIEPANELSDSDRAQYYSLPQYSYLRLLTAVPRFQSEEALAKESGLPLKKIREALEFLVSRGLCVQSKDKIVYGEIPTYLESSSPLISRHHENWRNRTRNQFDKLRQEDLVFTFPTVISETDFLLIREKIVQLIKEFTQLTAPSPSQNLYCLNIDWMKISSSE